MPANGRRRVITLVLFASLTAGCSGALADPQSIEVDQQFSALLEQKWPSVAARNIEILVDGIAVAVPDSDGSGQSRDQFGHILLPDKWLEDPQQALNEVDAADRTITIHNQESDQAKYKVFQIALDTAMWTEYTKQAWNSKLSRLQTESSLLISNQLAQAPDSQQDDLRQRLTASQEAAEQKLEEIILSLKAEGICTITATGANRPLHMTVESTFSCLENGMPREEIVRLTHVFQDQ